MSAAAHFLQLIADLVEICTIDEGAQIFAYLENCVPLMKARLNFESMGSPPKLAVLRICNQLLRRLSKAHHVMLAGRIHIFLSLILPSTDRSAVNATGLVNESHAINIADAEVCTPHLFQCTKFFSVAGAGVVVPELLRL